MRFQRLDLIKYGKFSNRSVDFPAAKQDFHLIVGPNEAGKSTFPLVQCTVFCIHLTNYV